MTNAEKERVGKSKHRRQAVVEINPTPDEIAAEAAKIRATWPAERLAAMGVWLRTACRKDRFVERADG